METSFQQDYTVLAHETGVDNLASPLFFVNRLQDIAGRHARALNISMDMLRKQNLTWFLAMMSLRIIRSPSCWDQVKVITWPSGRERLYYTREFLFQTKAGEDLAKATSAWFIFDLEQKKPVRKPNLPPFPMRNKRLLQTQNSHGIKPDQDFPEGKIIPVRWDDLDLNRHVNNAMYIRWALEAIPEDIRHSWRPYYIQANYRSGAGRGEKISSSAILSPGVKYKSHHLILRPSNKELLAAVEMRWEQK